VCLEQIQIVGLKPPQRNFPFPEWQLEYQAALLEVDPQKLPERVNAAEAAIFLRQQALVYSSDGHVERHAIEEATRALLFIKNENSAILSGKSRRPPSKRIKAFNAGKKYEKEGISRGRQRDRARRSTPLVRLSSQF
jgi:hypothetical protein